MYRLPGQYYVVHLLLSVLIGLFAGELLADSLPKTIEEVKNSIVGIGTVQKTRTPPAKLLATGFVITDGNTVATNAHAVSESISEFNQMVVFVGRGQKPEIRLVKNVITDAKHDLALLEIAGPPLPPLQFGNSKAVREGQVYAFTGFPIGAILGLYPATHQAMISAITPIAIPVDKSRQLDAKMIKMLRTPFEVFQLDGTAYPGNSGSPLYDPKSGRVIGIINMVIVKEGRENVLAKPSGIAFAIPINYLTQLLANQDN
jgi:S1-C subfamily serine protease